MKILVTGASGFIGNYVINYLVHNTNHQIITTSRNKERVKDKTWYPKVQFLEADLYSKKNNFFEFFENPDLLIHLAWSNLPNYSKSFHITENLTNDVLFLENIIDNGLKQLVVTGTCFEYGMQEGELCEVMPTLPQNPYAIAKDALRKYLEFKTADNTLRLLWLRLFYMYGKGQSPNSVISQLEAAIQNGEEQFNMSGGEQIRDYLPVENVAEYIVKCALNCEASGIINISSGKPIKLRDFIENYLKTIRKDIKLNLGSFPYSSIEPMAFWGKNKKLKNKI
jgi:nucleoside-diphosphate-sugar epimerase